MKYKDISDKVKRKNWFFKALTKVIVLFFLPMTLSIFDWGMTASFSQPSWGGIAEAQTVDTNDIVNRAVTTPKLAPRSVGRNKIKNGAVTSAKIRNGTIQSQDLDPAIDSAITDNTNTNATQQTTIDSNTAASTANTNINNTQQTAINANTAASTSNTNTNATQQTAIDANTDASTANTNTNNTQQTEIDTNTSEISALDIENGDQQLQIDTQQNDVNQLKLDTADQQIEIDANTTATNSNTTTNSSQQTAINANTATNGTQQLAIDANTALLATHDDTFNFISTINNSQQSTIDSHSSNISTNTSNISSNSTNIADLQSLITNLQQQIGNSTNDSSDGVYITFAKDSLLNDQPILDINGLNLFTLPTIEPFVFIGDEHDSLNLALTIVAQNTIPNTTLQQVITELPEGISEGTHRLTLRNSLGESEFDVKISGDGTGGNGEIGGNDEFTKLLLHFDGNFNDSSAIGNTVTPVGNIQIGASQIKFGSGSAFYDGLSENYPRIPDSDILEFGAEDFTIDFWVQFNNVTSNQVIYSKNQLGTNNAQWLDFLPGSNRLRLRVDPGGAFQEMNFTPFTPSVGIWYHIAAVRNGNDFMVFVDGQQVGSTMTASGAIGNYPSDLTIGSFANGFSQEDLDGYLDEFRISKGIARWTSNFTPPAESYN